MNGLFDHISAETALKWGVTILITGFIAQFGKRFATWIIEKVKTFRSTDKTPDKTAPPFSLPGNSPAEETFSKERLKAEKKREKALGKARKKSGGGGIEGE